MSEQKTPINVRMAVEVAWVIKERQDGLWVPVREFHNLVTSYGLTAYALAPAGQYTPPTYLVIDTSYASLAVQGNPGDITVQLSTNPTLLGDTQLVLSVGLPSQETVTFTGVTGSSPYTFTLTAPLTTTHLLSDQAVRAVTASDTMSSVVSEAQYDPTFNPNNRASLTAAYSPGTGQGTMQFFMSGLTATNLFFAHVGLTDQPIIGALNANLHNYAPLGYNHNNTNDLEIDVTYTLQTF